MLTPYLRFNLSSVYLIDLNSTQPRIPSFSAFMCSTQVSVEVLSLVATKYTNLKNYPAPRFQLSNVREPNFGVVGHGTFFSNQSIIRILLKPTKAHL